MDLLKISDYVNYVINGILQSFRQKILTCNNNTIYMSKEIYKIKYIFIKSLIAWGCVPNNFVQHFICPGSFSELAADL